MRAGRYRVRAEWNSVSLGDRFLRDAVVEVREGGCVLVYVDGEPLFEFPTVSVFLAAHSITAFDLVSVAPATRPRPGLHRVVVREGSAPSAVHAQLRPRTFAR